MECTFGFRDRGREQNSIFPRYDPAFSPASGMDAFFVSTGIVGLAKIGGKTRLLAFLLVVRFNRPLPIVLGIFVAILASHAFAAAVGAPAGKLLGPDLMRWVLGIGFIAMAAWIMVPDRIDGAGGAPCGGIHGCGPSWFTHTGADHRICPSSCVSFT
jgi:hypothetical protein